MCSQPPVLGPGQMPMPVRRRIASLETLHGHFEVLEEAHNEKTRQLEAEFMRDTAAILRRRQEIVSGKSEPSEEEVRTSAASPGRG